HDREAMKLAPENRAFRAELCNRLANLVWTQLHLAEHAQAARASEEMTRILPDDWTVYNDSALHLSACVSVADKALLSPQKRAEVTRRYTEGVGKMWREALRRCPDIAAEQSKLARTLSTLARWYSERDDQDTAQQLQEEARARRARATLLAKQAKPQ
ncbi:MAG: hypothetical protein L0Z62_31360, partial [Gemmataceae bacterium]|nr:hypothetical protein [Gemmataceae bacterium]